MQFITRNKQYIFIYFPISIFIAIIGRYYRTFLVMAQEVKFLYS